MRGSVCLCKLRKGFRDKEPQILRSHEVRDIFYHSHGHVMQKAKNQGLKEKSI